MCKEGKCAHGDEMLSLARGPIPYVKSFSGYITNGFRFHTIDRDKCMTTQNSGVLVVGNAGDGSGDIEYYGELIDVVMLEYLGGNHIVFFRCNWWDVLKGVKEDRFGFVSVNSKRRLKTNDPFILASQASQVFYASDIANKGWRVVVRSQPRDVYDMRVEGRNIDGDGNDGGDAADGAYQESESFDTRLLTCISSEDIEYSISHPRTDIEPDMVDIPSVKKKGKKKFYKAVLQSYFIFSHFGCCLSYFFDLFKLLQ